MRRAACCARLALLTLVGCAPDVDDASPVRVAAAALTAVAAPDACGGVDPEVLLDTGHDGVVTRVVRAGDRVLSVGGDRWILWDAAAGRQLASGTQSSGRWSWRFTPQLSGTTALLPGEGRMVDVVDAHDARVLARVDVGPTYAKLGLARDGSYLWRADGQTLRVLARDGTTLLERTGDYANAAIHAAPDALRVGARPDGSGALEILPVREAALAQGPGGTARDLQWFADGSRFFVRVGDDRAVYDLAGTLLHTVPGGGRSAFDRYASPLGGFADRIWQDARDESGDTLRVFRLGDAAPLATLPTPFRRDRRTLTVGSGGAVLGIFGSEADVTLHQLDVRGDAPHFATYRLPAQASSYDSDLRGGWAAGTTRGVVHVGEPGASDGARALGCGSPLAVAASPAGRVAIATDDGRVRVYDVRAAPRLIVTLEALTTTLAMTADGRHVVTRGERRYIATSSLNAPDQSVRVFSTDDGALVHRFAHAQGDQPAFMDFDLSADGRLARRLCTLADFAHGNGRTCSIEVTDLHGKLAYRTAPVSYSEPGNPGDAEPPLLSPSGRGLAFVVPSADGRWDAATTVIYEDGQQLRTVAGRARGWLGDQSLVLLREGKTQIVDREGRPLPTSADLTTRRTPSAVDAAHYFDGVDAIRRLSDGASVWSSDVAQPDTLTVAGDFVVLRAPHGARALRWR